MTNCSKWSLKRKLFFTCMLTLHLFLSKIRTHSSCCLLTATCNVLQPPLFNALIWAPFFNSSSITSGWFLKKKWSEYSNIYKMLHVPKDLKIIVLRSYWYQTFSSKFHKQYYPIKYQYFFHVDEKGISSFIIPF